MRGAVRALHEAHPGYWAQFAFVGEGGSPRQLLAQARLNAAFEQPSQPAVKRLDPAGRR